MPEGAGPVADAGSVADTLRAVLLEIEGLFGGQLFVVAGIVAVVGAVASCIVWRRLEELHEKQE